MAKYKAVAKIIGGPSKGVSFEGEERETCSLAQEHIADVYSAFVTVYNKDFSPEQAGDELAALQRFGWLEERVYKDGVELEEGAPDWLF